MWEIRKGGSRDDSWIDEKAGVSDFRKTIALGESFKVEVTF